MKKKIIIVLTLLLLLALSFLAFDTRLNDAEYIIESPKIFQEIKLILITDLHSCYYGEGQLELLERIKAFNPDAVLLGGDIFDDVIADDNAKTFVSEAAKKYSTYYVSGNHEWWSGRMYEIFGFLESCGVTVLRGESSELAVGEQIINICGIDDPDADKHDTMSSDWNKQLQDVSKSVSKEKFTLLLSHRPERAEEYFKYDFDLVLSGHAHGGQWRIPFLVNGIYAPNQGIFPKLAGGLYDFGGKMLIVSRGLARESTIIPRIFNRPEIVSVILK